MNERRIQVALMKHCLRHKHDIVIPNLTRMYAWEADLISVTRAGLVHEYEIKVSQADYKADFRKRAKHRELSREYMGDKWLGTPMEVIASNKARRGGEPNVPNYFWYVAHGFEIEVPDYAGLMVLVKAGTTRWVQIVKKAKRLHGRGISDRQLSSMNRWFSYKLSNAYDALHGGDS